MNGMRARSAELPFIYSLFSHSEMDDEKVGLAWEDTLRAIIEFSGHENEIEVTARTAICEMLAEK